jgi:hypothetical protein
MVTFIAHSLTSSPCIMWSFSSLSHRGSGRLRRLSFVFCRCTKICAMGHYVPALATMPTCRLRSSLSTLAYGKGKFMPAMLPLTLGGLALGSVLALEALVSQFATHPTLWWGLRLVGSPPTQCASPARFFLRRSRRCTARYRRRGSLLQMKLYGFNSFGHITYMTFHLLEGRPLLPCFL